MTDQHTETYQWFKDDSLLSPGASVIIRPRQELMVLNAQKSDAGVYVCVATNSAGSRNASAVVDVTSTVITCDGRSVIYRIQRNTVIGFISKCCFTSFHSIFRHIFSCYD